LVRPVVRIHGEKHQAAVRGEFERSRHDRAYVAAPAMIRTVATSSVAISMM
jgi:hypothetical protein